MKQRVARLPDEAEGGYRLKGEREVLQIADRVIAATLAEKAQLQWLYQADTRKIVIIPPGVELSHFYPIPPDEAKEFIGVPPCDRMLLFVGRIEPLKGIDTLIQAIALLHHRGLYVCLSVIGGEPANGAPPQNLAQQPTASTSSEMLRLEAMRKAAGVEDLITFLGKRAQDTLPYYYSAAEVVVVPSFYESFGMVALEAMACGTPVVASQVGGLAYLVQDGVTGFTVPVDEPEALADRLALILGDVDLRARLGRQAAELAQEYAWEKIARRIMDVYESVLGSKG